jgi:hypothetical protein
MAQNAKKLSKTDALYKEYLSFRKKKRYAIFQILREFRGYWYHSKHSSSDKSRGERRETLIKHLIKLSVWKKDKKFLKEITALSDKKEDELYYKIKEDGMNIKAERVLNELIHGQH